MKNTVHITQISLNLSKAQGILGHADMMPPLAYFSDTLHSFSFIPQKKILWPSTTISNAYMWKVQVWEPGSLAQGHMVSKIWTEDLPP